MAWWAPNRERRNGAVRRRRADPWTALAEVIWFALFSAWTDAAFEETCGSVLGLAIGAPGWAAELRAAGTGTLAKGEAGSEAGSPAAGGGPRAP